MNDQNYAAAFSYIVGYITTGEQFGLPLDAKKLFQSVYDNYGVLPIESITKKLGLEVKDEQPPR